MKRKTTLLILSALIGVNLSTSLAGNPPAKPKPDKAGAKQTPPSTTAQGKTEEELPGAAAEPPSHFYTGKPYDSDLGGYLFNYRTYSPEINRWITPDPSGFPDGQNNQAYLASPTYCVDYMGLFRISNTMPSPANAKSANQKYTVDAEILKPTDANALALLKQKLTASYADWQITYSDAPLTGTANIQQYKAVNKGRTGKDVAAVEFHMVFQGFNQRPGHSFQWIQIAEKGSNLPGSYNSCIDSGTVSNTPFYDQMNGNVLIDWPENAWEIAGRPAYSYFYGNAFAVDYTGGKSMTVYDGLRWGFHVE